MKKLFTKLLISIQWRLAKIWRETPFFIQGQMDIHPSSPWYNENKAQAEGGFFPSTGAQNRKILDHEPWDGVRRDMILLLLRSVEERGIPGLFAELGVYRGGTARLIHHYAPDRKLHLFDTFSGFDERDALDDKKIVSHDVDVQLFQDTGIEIVKENINQLNNNVYFHKGFFPDTFPEEMKGESFAFVHLDADLYTPILTGLKIFYPLLSPGGIIVVHDYNAWVGARRAVDLFCTENNLVGIPMPDKSGSIVLSKPL
jgi:O-methyltransferase